MPLEIFLTSQKRGRTFISTAPFNMNKPITLILGASTKPQRYSYLAAERLSEKDHRFILLGRSEGVVTGVDIQKEWPEEEIDTITLYIATEIQADYEDLILRKKPRRVIFNPGTENPPFAKKLKEQGIEPIIACTLVMLSTDQY